MDVKEAVRTAKDYLADLYIDEEIVNVGLEEVRYDYDTDKWHVTIGFSRPWGSEKSNGWSVERRGPT